MRRPIIRAGDGGCLTKDKTLAVLALAAISNRL